MKQDYSFTPVSRARGSLAGVSRTARGQAKECVDEMSRQGKMLVSVEEFAELSGLGPRLVRQLAHVAGFPAIHQERRLYIHWRAADAWLAEYAVHQDDRSRRWL